MGTARSAVRNDRMKRNIIRIAAVIAAGCLLIVLLTTRTEKPMNVIVPESSAIEDMTPEPPAEEDQNLAPEQRLIGIWSQTQEYLDYANENIHSASVTITDKERLEFRADGTCNLVSLYRGTVLFAYEYRDGYVVLTADGWAPQRFLLEDEHLINPKIGIKEFEKQSAL